jgi:hypothetical protein
MALLTIQDVTREAAAVLHEKADFIMSVNRQYDDSFAKTGAKKGTSLKIRMPNEYETRTGADWVDQGHDETSETLVVATQRGVDSSISDLDLMMSMDDFKTRVLEPQMSVLASIIEADALSMTYDISNSVGTPGTTPGSTASQALLPWLQAKQRLSENLAPGPYRAQIDGNAATYTINGLSGLFHEQRALAKQFTEGFLLRNSGIDYMQNNRVKRLTTGTIVDATAVTVNGANQGENGEVIVANCGNAFTLKKGQIVCFALVNDIHPETKESYGRLKQFSVREDFTSAADGSGTLKISPTIVTTGAKKNVSVGITTGAAVTVPGAVASTAYPCNLVYAKDAFAFVAADMEKPNGMDQCYTANIDKLPLRFIRWLTRKPPNGAAGSMSCTGSRQFGRDSGAEYGDSN